MSPAARGTVSQNPAAKTRRGGEEMVHYVKKVQNKWVVIIPETLPTGFWGTYELVWEDG